MSIPCSLFLLYQQLDPGEQAIEGFMLRTLKWQDRFINLSQFFGDITDRPFDRIFFVHISHLYNLLFRASTSAEDYLVRQYN